MSSVILASKSPRRSEILLGMGVSFTVVESQFKEYLDETKDPVELAKELALGKALSVAEKNKEAYVIGADTIVVIKGRQMEKPIDLENAREMLLALSEEVSFVITGVAIVNISKNITLLDCSISRVYFKKNSPEVEALREAYLSTNDWKDKAGGYGIQSGALPLIDHYEGSYTGIIGFPSEILSSMLLSLGLK